MVYVFFVQLGEMTTFDNEISIMQSVQDLKVKVNQKWGISLEQQVFLISGGESLDPKNNLCSYMAGTDTNPIFLFSTNFDVTRIEIQPSLTFDEIDLRQRLFDSCKLPPSLETLKRRTQLAQEHYDIAKAQLKFCECMVHDQHMQQQGWAAVIANLEDVINYFRKKWDLFENVYSEFLVDSSSLSDILQHLQDDENLLKRIPVLPTLLETQKQNAEDLQSSKTSEEQTTSSSQETEPKEISLFDFISSANPKTSLEECHLFFLSNIQKYENEIMPILKNRVLRILKEAETIENKRIAGLGKRLSGLNQAIQKIKDYVQHQYEMAQSFIQHQEKASSLGPKDISDLLEFLSASHQKQMANIGEYHAKLMDDREKIIKTKYELCKSLSIRLSWVTQIENQISELDSRIVFYRAQLLHLRKLLEFFQQLHLAPVTYMNAVAEVVRRRIFSQSFLSWASDIACHQLTIHNDEITRRKEFAAIFDGHFLTALFPGMSDIPPPFAIEAPSMFDAELPKVTEEDIERLKKEVPDLAENLIMADSSSALNFFKSTSKQEKDKTDDTQEVEEKLIQAVSDVGLASNLDKNLLKATGSEPCLAATAHTVPHLKDLDRGGDSETDTEEFEKVGQSPLELNFEKDIPAPSRPEKQDASTSTEVGERSPLPPRKPPRTFQKPIHNQPFRACSFDDPTSSLQRTVSVSNTESFANIKNISLDSINELSSLRNLSSSNTDSYFLSHYQGCIASLMLRSSSKSVSPQSPADFPSSPPLTGHQLSSNVMADFVNDEFYIDESLPSSISFENGNSQGEFVKQLDTVNNVVALLQDNLQISRTEHDKLRSDFINMGILASQAVAQLRLELGAVKTQVSSEKANFKQHCQRVSSSLVNALMTFDIQEKEAAENLRKKHETEIGFWKNIDLEKNTEIQRLQEEKSSLENEIVKSCVDLSALQRSLHTIQEESSKQVEELRKELENAEVQKDKLVKNITEKLKLEHKAEIDGIKSRFRLMTMERSPSNSSLEKSCDCSSPSSHTSLLVQMTENFQLEKEKAVEAALASEKEKYECIMSDRIAELKSRFAEDKEVLTQEIARRVSEDKDKQIDLLREREKNLNLECIKYKTTIQQLAEFQTECRSSELLDQINILKKENKAFQDELEKVRSEKVGDMTVSVSVCEPKIDATTSPVRQRHEMTRSEIITSSSSAPATVHIDSCDVGDSVMVHWDHLHESFMIFQESRHMYFLHSDSVEGLGLCIVDGKPNKMLCRGEVTNREFCQAKKSGNRYKVPKDTRFYRIKVRPVQAIVAPKENVRMSISQTVSSSCETVAEDASVSHCLPSSSTRLEVTVEEPMENLENSNVSREASLENNFATDSGIVENVESSTAAREQVEGIRSENDNDR